MLQTIHTLLDPIIIIKALGLAGVLFIIFAESGLFFGFFFPGDSLLFTAGFLASQNLLPPAWLFIGAFVAAVVGDSVGYAFGRKIGPKIFTKEDSFFFNKKYIERSERFYEKYGKKTIILARFIPVVRTFAPILAGVGNMSYRTFISYNVVGGLLWSVGISALGFGLGAIVPNASSYITPIVVIIIIVSIIPPIREYTISRRYKEREKKSKA
ncbi:MAG: DedA family protein [Candidatus Pacebacteria bacterium]|nr:DedA family protein [Candidatus Paceibacterota bacterium]